MQTLSLKDYNIYIGNNGWTILNKIVQNDYSNQGTLIIVDENTAAHCLPILATSVDFGYKTIQIPAGEVHKNIETCISIWAQMMARKLGRKSLVINLGGGVIGDMGGFCASTFKRGMDFIQIPTTLLSQVDASVGGKLGVDFQEVKNSIGLFKNPKAVLVMPQFLQTLPWRELRSGFAEMLKHGLIADAEQWENLRLINREGLQNRDWTNAIGASIAIKQQVVEQDPFERGLRKSLNFGHTIGHAIESYFLKTDTPLLHGEAIAIGIVCESYLSHLKTDLPLSALNSIQTAITNIYDHQHIPVSAFEDLIELMHQDKKNEGIHINFTLLNAIGDAAINQTANLAEIGAALDFYNKSTETEARARAKK